MGTKINIKFLNLVLKYSYCGLILLMTAFFFYPQSSHAEIVFSPAEKELIKEINNFREKNKLEPLKVSEMLSKTARDMAKDMSDHPDDIDQNNHVDSQGKNLTERAAEKGYTAETKENIAAGHNQAETAIKVWKKSSSYRNKLLSSSDTVLGVAKVTTNNHYKWYWSVVIGTTVYPDDVIAKTKYSTMKKLSVVVTGENGTPVKKAKITVLNSKGKKLSAGKTGSKGKEALWISAKNVCYVKATAKGYTTYTNKVNVTGKKTPQLKMWLEKQQ